MRSSCPYCHPLPIPRSQKGVGDRLNGLDYGRLYLNDVLHNAVLRLAAHPLMSSYIWVLTGVFFQQ